MALFGTGLLVIGAFVRKRLNSNHSSTIHRDKLLIEGREIVVRD